MSTNNLETTIKLESGEILGDSELSKTEQNAINAIIEGIKNPNRSKLRGIRHN